VSSYRSAPPTGANLGSPALTPVGIPGRRARHGWFEKTIEDVTGALESAVFTEEMASLPGVWQRVNARAKVVAAVALILAVALAHSIPALVVLYCVALLVAVAGRLPLGFFIKRVWLFLPLFTGVIVLPALFSFITPGRAVFTISSQPPVAITEQGLRGACYILLRVAGSVSFAIILVLTTRWNDLLPALRALRVPQVFVLILGMTYRYIFLLLHTANDMFLARKSRLVGRVSGSAERVWIAGSMGVLLGKSYHLSEDVYLAMVSRGFRGEARALDPHRLQLGDWAVVIAALVAPIAVLTLGG
jgi:cobalt/nickel transport system permease protein